VELEAFRSAVCGDLAAGMERKEDKRYRVWLPCMGKVYFVMWYVNKFVVLGLDPVQDYNPPDRRGALMAQRARKGDKSARA
jgi:hypothetical protein